ncbi:uncharacterized protein LOC126570983 [Anopheles aquasalis]|uniref:uncharacterized protein LOC126570983 n=1 Tax=Anopheles aquasalis TaxID=42839 RepID=UPI00215A0EC7|nr:uncharacterized protein LOC126570983 [Anopheles aquasalis]
MYKRKWYNKQYCGDNENDPFEFTYRGSVFDPFADTAGPLPTAGEQGAWSGDSLSLELIENIPLPAHRLSGKVRQQYLQYLEQVIQKNYRTWKATSCYRDNPFSHQELRQCAETIEIRAVQACMITSLYRDFLLEKIREIRKQTAAGVLHPNILDVKLNYASLKPERCHVAMQTDDWDGVCNNDYLHILQTSIPAMSLDDKMRKFHEARENHEQEQARVPPLVSDYDEPRASTPAVTPAAVGSRNVAASFDEPKPAQEELDDEILKELEAMFEPEDDETDIFEWNQEQQQVKAIISEIERATVIKCEQAVDAGPDPISIPSPQVDVKLELVEMDPQPATTTMLSSAVANSEDLRRSMWPCELHMQRMKLRNLLVRIADDDYRRYEALQSRFVTLFGEDDGEEQDLGPYSPSIELNEVLLASCRQRIARWVVQALMGPLKDGLIANRYLFKKLAKRLAENIIYLDQYPDKKFIRQYVGDYFCSHSCIRSIDDIT